MKNNVKKKRSKIERLRERHRQELKKTRPDLYQFDEEFKTRRDSCKNEDELEEVIRWALDQPLYAELLEASRSILEASVGNDLDIYWEGLPEHPKPNLPMQLMALIEEMSIVCGTKAEDNITWQTAKSAVVAYQKYLEAKRLPKSTPKRIDKAAERYWKLLGDLGRQLVFRGLEPFQGTLYDPLTWFFSLDEIIKGTNVFPSPKPTVSKIRYYSRLGLIPKPIRVGEKGRALYPPTIWPRLALIHLMKEEGYTIKDVKAGLPFQIRKNIEPFVRGWEFGYNIYAELASPERESFLRRMETAFTEKSGAQTGEKPNQ